MPSNNERFRNEFATKILDVLPPDKVNEVLRAFDITSGQYEINRKAVELITVDGVPEIVKRYIASKAIAGCSKKTLNQYRLKMINFFSVVKKTFTDIHTDDIRLYLNYCKEFHNACNSYLDNIRLTINGFFQWLVENDYIIRNPCANVERIKFNQKTREPLDSYDMECVRWNTLDIRELALLNFLYSTGMRVGECAQVRLSDINWNDRSVKIRHGKGDKERYVYFNAESEFTLKKYLESRNDDSDGLFVSKRKPHQPIQEHALENIIKNVAMRSSKKLTPHILRHTFATDGLNRGMPLDILQQLMGHVKPETTMIYAKQNQQRSKMEHNRVYS